MDRAEEGRLIRRHMPIVRAIVRNVAWRLPPNVLVEDLLAAGTYGLLAALRQNGGDGGPTFKAYAGIRVRGEVLDELRRLDFASRGERRRSSPSLVDVPEHLPDPVDTFEEIADAFDNERLSRAMSFLEERERQVVYARAIEGLRLREIGARLHLSSCRIHQIYRRAVERLRAALAA